MVPDVETGYWAPAVVPLPPAAPTRRPYVVVGLVVGLLAVVLAGVAGTRRVQAAAVGEVYPVETDAPASAGWGPTWVDERGRPARWDPCTPIRYVVQAGWIPDAGRADLTEALRLLSQASGLRFVDDGDTAELPSQDRASYQPAAYGERWAPLLIGWVPAASTDLGLGGTGLGGGVQGVSSSVAVPGPDGASLVTGQVVLDATNRLAPGFGPGTTEGEVLLHELAHAVGLGHVLDPTQVMYPQTTNGESVFGAGDRAGLAAVGAAAGCRTAPAPG